MGRCTRSVRERTIESNRGLQLRTGLKWGTGQILTRSGFTILNRGKKVPFPRPEIGPSSGIRSVHCSDCDRLYRISTGQDSCNPKRLILKALRAYPEIIEHSIRASSG